MSRIHHGPLHGVTRFGSNRQTCVCILCMTLALCVPALMVVAEGAPGGDAAKSETVISSVGTSPAETAGAAPRIEVAALQPVPELLSSMSLASAPDTQAAQAVRDFAQVESVREQGQAVSASAAYISLIERYPDTPQAKAADSRANYLMNRMAPAQLAELEASLPAPESLTNLKSLIVLGQFHVLRARQLAETDPAAAAQHIQTVYGMAWKAFEDDLDDDYKKTILEEYLLAADTLGKGEDTRARLSAHADTLPWTFTRWLIKAEIDGVEADPQLIPTQEGLESVRKSYLLKGRESSDPEKAKAYFTKSRDVALRLLKEQPFDTPRFDLAHYYLEAADAVGSESAVEAVAFVEEYLKSQPLSIMRWIARYELAVYLTRAGASAEQTVAGYQHFETMLVEADTGLVEKAIANLDVDVELRGLLACVWGHACAGTNRVDDAKLFYDWVLEYCPAETHPGESAAYAKAVAFQRQHADDPAACAAAYEEYVRENPSAFYSPHALISVAEIRENARDAGGAIEVYERVEREYPNRSETARAQTRRDTLMLKGAAQ